MNHSFGTCSIFVFLCLAYLPIRSQQLTITDKIVGQPILPAPNIRYAIFNNPFPDVTSIYKSNAFQPFTDDRIHIPEHDLNDHFWLHFQIKNQSGKKDFEVILDNYFIDEIAYFLLKDGKLIKTYPVVGDNYPFENRPTKSRNFVFPIIMQRDSTYEIFLRVNTHGRKITVHPMIMENSIYFEWEATKRSNLFLFYGMLLSLVLIISYLAIVFRDKIFGLLGLFLFAALLGYICLGGWFNQYFSSWPFINHKVPILLCYFMLTTAFLFSREFMIENFKHNWFKNVTTAMIVTMLFGCAASMTIGWIEFIGVWVMYKFLGFSFAILFVCGILSFRKQHPTARYLTAGLLCLSVVLLLDLSYADSGEYFITRKSSLLIFGSGLFLLGLSVIDRLTILKVEKEQAQEQVILHLKEMQDLRTQQKLQVEKDRISKDLHDNIGAQLTSLTLGLRQHERKNSINSSTVIQLEEEINSIRLELREMIWALNKEDIDLDQLVDKIRNMFWWFQQKNEHISFKVSSELKSPIEKIMPSYAVSILRIVQEATINSLKHSGCSKIELEAQLNGNQFIINLCDNGKGFDLSREIPPDHFGISNIRKRAEDIKARLNIDSSDSGTRIVLSMLISPV